MKITLHAGAAKTGSTAIQNFLSRNHNNLKRNSVLYSEPRVNIINSGNGVGIMRYLRGGDELQARKFIESLVKQAEELGLEHVILSSETFSGFHPRYINKLRDLVEDTFSEVNCIIYVRNPVDWTYALWMQQIKRKLCTESFYTFYPKIARTHLTQVLRFNNTFKNSKIISYDANKKQLIKSFLEYAEIPNQGLDFSTSQSIINRSLTEKEIEFMLYVNKSVSDCKFSVRISDFLISTYPDINVSGCIDEKIRQHILSLNEADLLIINQVIQAGEKIC